MPRKAGDGPTKTTAEREYSDDELELLRAVDAYRRKHRLKFLAVTDWLRVMKDMGYRKGDQPGGGETR